MAQFIAPIIDNMLMVLQKYTPGLAEQAGRAPFVDFGKRFTWNVVNFPSIWVMPVRTAFDTDAQNMRWERHQVQIKFAVQGSEPDDLDDAAMAYMAAIDNAIAQSDPADWADILTGGVVLRVFVQGHDYGPLFEKGGMMTRFPELELIVDAEEL
jgi:hypothetical protein